MAKVTERDKEIISVIFKEKINYLEIYDDNLELIDFIKEMKEDQLKTLLLSLNMLHIFL